MRTLLFATILTISLCACNNEKASAPSTTNDTTAIPTKIDTVKAINEAAELTKDKSADEILKLANTRVEQNSSDAALVAQLYKAAAEKGNAEAQFKVAMFYGNGIGLEANQKKAVEYLEKAALQNDTLAMFALACCYANGQGVEQDEQKMIYWSKKAATLDCKLAKQALRGIGAE